MQAMHTHIFMCSCVCLISLAHYPQAATNLQSCFGEELGYNVSKKFVINLQWELPEGNKIILHLFMLFLLSVFCCIYCH